MNLAQLLSNILETLFAGDSDRDEERSLFDGSDMIGDMNFRTHRMDCGQDPGGYYEDDL